MKTYVTTHKWQFYPIDETQYNTLAGDPTRLPGATPVKIARKGSRTDRLLVYTEHPQRGILYAWVDADQIESPQMSLLEATP
jgi:hypothetical protein